jgi:hypothetical protein
MKAEKNPFKEMANEPLPENLKEKVMHSIEMSQLIMDVADLFFVKMGKTFSHLFKTNPDDFHNDTNA